MTVDKDETSFDRSAIISAPGTVSGNATFIEGGLGNVRGLRSAGISAGFRRNPNRRDFALVITEKPAVASGLFTTNRFAAAPVFISRAHLLHSSVTDALNPAAGEGVRAIIINSGQANASTGEPGLQTAELSARLTAEIVKCQPHQVLVASTGVIGKPIDSSLFDTGIQKAYDQLGSPDGTDIASGLTAAEAIMTTDTYAKQAAVRATFKSEACEYPYSIAGMVKGSGMIEPNMATLLGVFATDALLSQAAADAAFKIAIGKSLNKLTVDSDTSTNDSVFFLATGAAVDKIDAALQADNTAPQAALIEPDSEAFEQFTEALTTLCIELARQTAADGEGATKLVTVKVSGALDDAQADRAARAVANSPLVKTAIAGHDANWGRICAALGKSGAVFEPEQVSVKLMGLSVFENGLPVDFDEDEALVLFDTLPEIVIEADLGTPGNSQTTIWTCDLTHGYISINGDYRS